MDEPKSLDRLFKEKIFRIPDFQRGYAWQKSQLKDFWEDLINLADNRSHYTGVLTLKQVANSEIIESDKEYWLIEDHSYNMYHVIDGQQRLTTFVIFLQAFLEFVRQLPENKGKSDDEIFITESLNLSSVISKYLYEMKPTGDKFRTYKFGYTVDNPSYTYLRYKIFNEKGAGLIDETFYTLNLKNAKQYFYTQFEGVYKEENLDGLHDIYKKITKRFHFNEYIIKDEYDVFIAFETMNNRGKKLSDLELLKNRLIYLSTLYSDKELDVAERTSLRDAINDAWKEVYHQLGRNYKRPLNDDDFLKAHWIMYYKYSRVRGNDYIKYLLDEQFSPQKVHKKIESEVQLEMPEEQLLDIEFEEDENGEIQNETVKIITAALQPIEIKEFVNSLKESSIHWFNSYYPELATDLDKDEKYILEKLNRIGIGYFRPLVMSILKNEPDPSKRIEIFSKIERFIFVTFRLANTRSNYCDSEFYNAARELDRAEITLENIEDKMKSDMHFTLDENNIFTNNSFYEYLRKKFTSGNEDGYYSWNGLRYFLYEYEQSLKSKSRQLKVSWEDLLKTPKDKISIEHIFPQTATKSWKDKFKRIPDEKLNIYHGSLGNLLLLSMSINSSLQNDSFEDKKEPKYSSIGQKIRNGYSDGSHSEIEVSQYNDWNAKAIKERGMKLLSFMEERWDFRFKNEKEKEELILINYKDSEE